MRSIASCSSKPALRCLPGARSVEAGAFAQRAAGASRLLRSRRALARRTDTERSGAGRLVLLSARNLDSYPLAIAALWGRGAVPLLADADLSRAEIGDLVSAFRPAYAILDRDADPGGGRIEDLGEDLAGLHAWVPGAQAAAARGPDMPPDTAVVRLTSGTTGRPRGIAVTADQLLADARQITRTMGIQPGDSMVAAIPLGHAYGFVHVLMALVLQGTGAVLVERPLPALLVEALSGPGPLVMAGTPYLFELLLQAAGRRRFKGLRLCLSAGAPLSERLARAFRDRFGLPIRTFYGASECGGITYDRSAAGIVPDGCVGTPLDGVTVSLDAVPGEDGAPGRICVRSRAVASGYVGGDPDRALRPGLFRSSDLGRLDEAGRLRLFGRIDRLINVGGRKVNPAEVEDVLRAHPRVRAAVVFGAPDRSRGEAVCACLVTARGLTRETVLAACRARLAPFKIPRRIEFVEALPLNARGKVDRRALARLVSSPPIHRRS